VDTIYSKYGPSQLSRRASPRPIGGMVKRAMDIVVSSLALLALSPLLIAVWIAVRLETPGPGLFVQPRGGYRGHPFNVYKFRTMHAGGDQTRQTERNDARVTRLGRILRRSSIDELPQLLNILKGDMSIVGPRPHALDHDRRFQTIDPRYVFRFRARPGLTGLAQVSGSRGPTRTDEDVRRRVGFDLEYIDRYSPLEDAIVMLRTVPKLFSSEAF